MFFQNSEPYTLHSSLNESVTAEKKTTDLLKRSGYILLAVTFFLFSLNILGVAFQRLSSWALPDILSLTQNPFISLFIGLLVTALIQSSSTVTSMIVAAVAVGSLPLTQAVPMVMGANIGTTLTSTLISLGFITRRNEFRRALSAGTVHTFFNLLTVCLLLPLELYNGSLSRLASGLASWLGAPATEPSVGPGEFTYGFWHTLISLEWVGARPIVDVILLLVAFALLFLSIKWLAKLIYTLFIGRVRANFHYLIFSNRYRAFAWGTMLTAAVQSSSVTSPLVVPLVATGKLSVRKCFPYIIGANVGTTLTALIAAMFHSQAALSIALAHVLFNLTGALLFLPSTVLSKVPVRLAMALSKLTASNRLVGFAYILITFFLLPFLLIYLSQ